MSRIRTAFLNDYQFFEEHQSEPIHASPKAILNAIQTIDMRSDRVIDTLLKVRETPTRIGVKLFDSAQLKTDDFGLHKFTLLERTATQLSLGLVGRFWHLDMGLIYLEHVEDFQAFNNPTAAKMVLQFEVVGEPSSYILQTRTFVYCPNRKTKLLFLPYWLLIRVGSGWIRQRTLKLIQKQFTTI